jgi:hypothetical protein
MSFKKNQDDEADVNNIITIEDEQQFWSNKYLSDKSTRSKYFFD